MSYQDKIYNQNGKGIKNSTAPVIKTSSDICVFSSPLFTMVGGDKIQCSDVTFDVSGTSFSDIYSATTECFIINNLDIACFNDINWNTNIYEDDNLVYSSIFYTSNSIFGDEPTLIDFTLGVTTAFNILGYDYEVDGSTYNVNQIRGIGNLKIDIETNLNYSESCPLTGASSGNTFTGTCEDINSNIVDINYNNLVSSDNNVFPITGQTSIALEFIFTGNTGSFENMDTKFKFEIYEFNEVLGFFNQSPKFTSPLKDWATISGTSAFTETISVDNLNIDGNYLVKGYYVFNKCTEFANLLGQKYTTEGSKLGDEYRLYNANKDFYFVVFNNADVPLVESGDNNEENVFGVLKVISQILPGGTDQFSYPVQSGDLIVNLNGLTLGKGLDYSIEPISEGGRTVLKLSGDTYDGDVLTYIYTSSDESKNNIKQDVIDVVTTITNGSTNNQGDNKVFFNTTKNKYELYMEMTPVSNNDVVVTINGMALANNIDYYLSSSNPKRIILEGDIIIGDIINIWYNTNIKAQGNIFSDTVIIDWSIINPPKLNDRGKFTLELSSDLDFTNIINSIEVPYIQNIITYSTILGLVGSAGDKVYYRVKNEKKFIDICGGPIISTSFSEIVDITIQTNSINSY
jgi:hypothetical protein